MGHFRRSARAARARTLAAISLLVTLTLAAAALAAANVASAASAPVSTPFAFEGANPCFFPAEPFTGTGTLHLLVGANVSDGGTAQSRLQASLSGLQAVTLTGKKYVVVDTENQTVVFDTPDLQPFVTTVEWTVQFIRVGEDGSLVLGDDFEERIAAHVTVNATGVPTVDRYEFDTRCR